MESKKITAEEARILTKEHNDMKTISVPEKIYASIRKSAQRGKTSIDIPRINKDIEDLLRKEGFYVAASNALGRMNDWSRTIIAWNRPPYNEPPKGVH